MLRILVVAVLTALAACAGGSTPDADGTDARARIEEQGRRWIAAVEAEDAAAMAEVYTEDALFMPPGSPTLAGRDTIRSLFEAQFEAMDAEYDFSIEQTEVAEDWAWRRGSYEVVAPLPNGDTLRADDKFVDIWRRDEDGRWRIAVDIWNANPEPEPEERP